MEGMERMKGMDSVENYVKLDLGNSIGRNRGIERIEDGDLHKTRPW